MRQKLHPRPPTEGDRSKRIDVWTLLQCFGVRVSPRRDLLSLVAAAGDVRLYLIFHNGAVEGLEAALYSVLELSIPLWKLSNYFVWIRRSVTGWNALDKTHYVPCDETMPRGFMFVQLSHCEAFSCLVETAEEARPINSRLTHADKSGSRSAASTSHLPTRCWSCS
jgi:hypothetical protein